MMIVKLQERRNLLLILLGIVMLGVLGGLALWWAGHPREQKVTSATMPPILLDRFQTRPGQKPGWVFWSGKNLYVSYFGRDYIDICSPKGKVIKTFQGTVKNGVGTPQGMGLIGDRLFVADISNQSLLVFNPQGGFLEAYNKKPNQEEITPVGVAVYNRVVYVTDKTAKGWMAIGDDGYFINSVRGKSEQDTLEFPYGIIVTPDGRVIVTDPQQGKIKVYTCPGWYAYDFPTQKIGLKNPQGLAIDGFGRIHVVDNGTNQVFVYNSKGDFLLKYGEGLAGPASIAIDLASRHIYLANTEKSEVVVYYY